MPAERLQDCLGHIRQDLQAEIMQDRQIAFQFLTAVSKLTRSTFETMITKLIQLLKATAWTDITTDESINFFDHNQANLMPGPEIT